MNKFIFRTDSYKVTHWPVYPSGTEYLYSYLESRGGLFSETVMFGTEIYLRKYLTTVITQDMVDYAAERFILHFGDAKLFNRAGWEYIVNEKKGILPLKICAAPEGLVVPTRNVLLTITNTDPKCAWLVNYVESLLLKLWYPITVATLSREIKKVIKRGLDETGTPAALPFALNDFGYRGVESEESAEIGGAAHLVNFMGTDNLMACELAYDLYGATMAGHSVPSTEHSVMTARGENGEVEQMKRFLETFKDSTVPVIACVSDSYDIFRACAEYWGGQLKNQVKALTNKMLVVRPDSGDPSTIVRQVVETLDKAFGHTVNDKGFKVLNNVRVIQGDGITLESIKRIIDELIIRGWSIDNIVFGMGGALLQQVNRDTQKFAIKASSITINGKISDIYKDPITDNGKRSKRGRFKLVYQDGVLTTVDNHTGGMDQLVTVYEDGQILNSPTFADIRKRAEL